MKRVQNWRSRKDAKGNRVAPHVRVDDVERVAPLQRFGDVTGLVILVLPGAAPFHRFNHVPFTKSLDFGCRGRVAGSKDSDLMAPPDEFLCK